MGVATCLFHADGVAGFTDECRVIISLGSNFLLCGVLGSKQNPRLNTGSVLGADVEAFIGAVIEDVSVLDAGLVLIVEAGVLGKGTAAVMVCVAGVLEPLGPEMAAGAGAVLSVQLKTFSQVVSADISVLGTVPEMTVEALFESVVWLPLALALPHPLALPLLCCALGLFSLTVVSPLLPPLPLAVPVFVPLHLILDHPHSVSFSLSFFFSCSLSFLFLLSSLSLLSVSNVSNVSNEDTDCDCDPNFS